MSDSRAEYVMIPVDQIDPTAKSFHSVRYFLDSDIRRLAASLQAAGFQLDQPIGVRPTTGDFSFEVVFGRRRLLAVRHLGMEAIPAQVLDLTDQQAALISLRRTSRARGRIFCSADGPVSPWRTPAWHRCRSPGTSERSQQQLASTSASGARSPRPFCWQQLLISGLATRQRMLSSGRRCSRRGRCCASPLRSGAVTTSRSGARLQPFSRGRGKPG